MNESNNGIIVAINTGEFDFDKQLEELELLSNNIDIEIIFKFIQKRQSADKKFYVGKGKLEELKEVVLAYKPNVLIFNDSITSLQRKILEKSFNDIKLLDRNEVILEIFKRNAKTAESKLQVKLATLTYELPKLMGMGTSLSRIGGGARTSSGAGSGTRGSGETLLEYNRRTIKSKINALKEKLKEAHQMRDMKNKQRNKSPIPKISILGYTSAGKSTLLKTLSEDDDILISQKLFSTLSTLSRRVKLPSGLPVIFSDTVGFIRKLPIALIESFKSTLDEINYADIIIEIIDCSEKNYEDKKKVVENIISDIITKNIPRITVFNKMDLLTKDQLNNLKILYPNALFVSAKSKNSVQQFLNDIEKRMIENEIITVEKFHIPFNEAWKIEKIRGEVGIKNEIQNDTGITLEVIAKTYYIEKLKSNTL